MPTKSPARPIALVLLLFAAGASTVTAATPTSAAESATTTPPAVTPPPVVDAAQQAHDALVARLHALSSRTGAFGPAYEPLYRAALRWYKEFGGNPPHSVDEGMAEPAEYATELADALEAGRNYFADHPRALFPLVYEGRDEAGGQRRMNYWLILPDGFGTGRTKFPLVITLHGSGWLGHKISFVREARKPRSGGRALEVTPINEAGPWQIGYLNGYLDELLRILPVDADRVYVQGHSLGAMATWNWALQDPQRFAAICPQAGIGQPYRAARMVDVPAWVVHGELDDAVPSGFSDEMVTALQDCGGRVRYSRLPGVGHNMPADFDGGQVVEWFLRQSRRHTPIPADPLAAIEFGPDGCSRPEVVDAPPGRFWHSDPVNPDDPAAMLGAARSLFAHANAGGALVDAPLVVRRELGTGTVTLWLEPPKTLRREAVPEPATEAVAAGRCLRFYFRGEMADGIKHAERIANEAAAQGAKPTRMLWMTPLAISSDPAHSIVECRLALE